MKKFDQNFIQEIENIKNTINSKYGFKPINNIMLLIDQLIKLNDKEGIYVELGTFRGSTLLSCAEAVKFFNLDVNLFGIDTFNGFPEQKELNPFDHPNHFVNLYENGLISKFHYESAAERTKEFSNLDHLESIYFKDTNNIFNHVENYDNVKLIESEIKNSENKINEPIKLLFFDCDLYDSYLDGLNLFYERVIDGGVIVFEEYYSFKYPGALQAIIDFFKNKNHEIIKYQTPEGFERAMIIKK